MTILCKEERFLSKKRQRKEKSAFAQTIKTGIIQSNLIPLFAGAMLAIVRTETSLTDHFFALLFATIGSALIIGAAGVYNNIYDRDIDTIMERTKKRPTVTGEIPNQQVWLIGISFTIVGSIFLYLASPMTLAFGLAGLFLYVFPYTMWTKRSTIWNTEVGALSGAMPPLIGWTAVTNDLMDIGLLALFVIMLFWQLPHFYAIAVRKVDDYTAANVPMLPVVKGIERTYKQTHVYLILLIASSFLLAPISWFLTAVSLLLGGIWWYLSYKAYRTKDAYGWATVLFFYSLIHLTVLFVVIILYSIIVLFLRA